MRDGNYVSVDPTQVNIGEVVQILPGGKVPLDGILLSGDASFNTAALTGESVPRLITTGEPVLAGMLDLADVVTIRIAKRFEDSSLAKILDMVQNATKRKAKTERFIYRFARIYTPIVVALATLLVVVPFFVLSDYVFETWLYRALVFLVISCPCALVISIPLGYFGGIGAASRNGILFKGSNYLDRMMRANVVVMDKTGTLTEGVFSVQQVESTDSETGRLIRYTASLEKNSTHPIAQAIVSYAGKSLALLPVIDSQEIAGHGLKGSIEGVEVLAGNLKLLDKFNISYPPELNKGLDTIVAVAIDGRYAGHFVIADVLKEDALAAIHALRNLGIKKLVMLSGDRDSVTQRVATTLEIDQAYGDLLPEDKVRIIEQLKSDPAHVIAFAGDGINDAPALALADVGIAMGGLGSDLAIETADVVIQTDEPSKIAQAIRISRATNRIVWQNISMAFGVKVVVLILGAGGLAGMWEAVFADVGVALLAILNAVRIQRMNFLEE
jgi:Cd2+/Zn2+-exporting ATPase